MGTIDLSKGIGLSGRIGPMIAYVTKDGKQVFRSYAKPSNPRSPKQKAHRAKFALVNKALSPLNKVIKQGYPDNKNAYRSLVGKAYHEAIRGEYPHYALDYSKIQIAVGKLQLPRNIRVRFDPLSLIAFFSWNPQLGSPSHPGSGNDKVEIVCFNTERPFEIETFFHSTRADGRASVELPKRWQPGNLHFWLYFKSPDLMDRSDSFYLHGE